MKIYSFDDVRNFLNDIPNINCGGCGIAALSMFLWTKEHEAEFIDDFKLIYKYTAWSLDAYEDNVAYFQGKRPYPNSCGHALIKHKNIIQDTSDTGYDCSYFFTSHESVIDAPDIEDFLRKSINHGSWNRFFNRKKYVPYIEKNLKINLDVSC